MYVIYITLNNVLAGMLLVSIVERVTPWGELRIRVKLELVMVVKDEEHGWCVKRNMRVTGHRAGSVNKTYHQCPVYGTASTSPRHSSSPPSTPSRSCQHTHSGLHCSTVESERLLRCSHGRNHRRHCSRPEACATHQFFHAPSPSHTAAYTRHIYTSEENQHYPRKGILTLSPPVPPCPRT